MAAHNRYQPSSYWSALKKINIQSALAMAAFLLFGAIQFGVASWLITELESVTWGPVVVSLVAMIVLLVSSDSRSPENYHPGEWVTILVGICFMILHAALPAFQDFVADPSLTVYGAPVPGIVLTLYLLIVGVMLSR